MADKIDIYELVNKKPIIFWRIDQQNFSAVEALLKAGADIEIHGGFGMTPVIWAASSDNWRMVKLLINRGADLSAYAGNGMTVANMALGSRLIDFESQNITVAASATADRKVLAHLS